MEKIRQFLARKDVVFTLQRYGIDALGAMAQGLFCTLLVGTILNTLGQQFGIGFLTRIIVTVGKGEGAVGYTIGGLASAMVGPGIAVAIGFALHCPTLVLFSLIPVGFDNTPRQRIGYNEALRRTFRDERIAFTAQQVQKETARCLGCGASIVDPNKCIGCGVCTTKCAFDAIHLHRERPECSTMYACEDKMKAILPYMIKRNIKIKKAERRAKKAAK